MNVNPGELNKKILIVQEQKTKDSNGYYTTVTVPVHACMAKFVRVSGKEMMQHNADFSEVKARFLIRYTKKKISRKMVVEYDNEKYEIQFLNNYGDQDEYIEIWTVLKTLEDIT